jgi:hypothetical protein
MDEVKLLLATALDIIALESPVAWGVPINFRCGRIASSHPPLGHSLGLFLSPFAQ